MSGSKGIDLLIADKVAELDEKSVEALDCWPSYDGPGEKNAGQESVEELNRGFFYFNDRFLDGYSDNGDLIWIRIGRPKQGARAGTTFWFRARNRWQCSFPRRKANHRYIQGGVMDGGVRDDYWVRSTLGLSGSVEYRWRLFPMMQTNAKRNGMAMVENLNPRGKLFRRSNTDSTGSAFGNRGRS